MTNVFQNCAYDSPIADHLCFLGHATWSNTNRNEWPTYTQNTTLCPPNRSNNPSLIQRF